MNAQKPTLSDVLKSQQQGAVAKVRTTEPGKVVSYDRTTQTAVVSMSLQAKYKDQAGNLVSEAQPTVSGPVLFPSAGPVSIVWDLAAGDSVIVLFCARSLDEWKTNAEGAQPHAPQDARRFSSQDIFVLPAGMPPCTPLGEDAYKEGALVIRGEQILLGDSTADDPVALSNQTDANFSIIQAALASLGVIVTLPSVAAEKVFAQ